MITRALSAMIHIVQFKAPKNDFTAPCVAGLVIAGEHIVSD